MADRTNELHLNSICTNKKWYQDWISDFFFRFHNDLSGKLDWSVLFVANRNPNSPLMGLTYKQVNQYMHKLLSSLQEDPKEK